MDKPVLDYCGPTKNGQHKKHPLFVVAVIVVIVMFAAAILIFGLTL
jgi:hypothetical protein